MEFWQVNTAEQPYGPSPHGRSWGDTPWDVAYQLPAHNRLASPKHLLMRFTWWRLEPHPEWVEPHWSDSDYIAALRRPLIGAVRALPFLPAPGSAVKMKAAWFERDLACHFSSTPPPA